MKVLVISNYRSRHSVRPEAALFIGLAKQGYDITIMTYGDADYCNDFKKASIKVIDFHPEKKYDKKEINFIRSELKDGQYDILHAFNSVSSVNGIQAVKGTKVKMVLYRGYCGNISMFDPLSYTKYLHPRVDAIMCNSIGVENLIKSQLLRHKSKAVTVNKGHDVEWYNNIVSHDIRKELDLAPDTVIFVCVANNRRMKGIPYLLNAFKQMSTKTSHLLLVGNDMYDKKAQAILGNTACVSRVHFLGFRKDALSIVKSSDVFVLSSIKGESITKSVIEAMCLERACIITDIPGNTELLEHDKSGVVVNMKDSKHLAEAMDHLAENKAKRKALGKGARLYIKNALNHKNAVKNLAKFYESLFSD